MFAELFPRGFQPYLIGGVLIGLGISLLYLTTGRPGGISTFYSAFWSWFSRLPFFQQTSLRDTRHWRLIYALGLLLGGTLFVLLGQPVETSQLPAWKLLIGGLLIGFGARLGGGCTSGHGICGMASLSAGSLVMVGLFLGIGIITANLFRWLGV